MKKIIVFAVLLFFVLNFKPAAAKVLSEDYLFGVSKVSLQAGQLFLMCEKEIPQPFQPTVSTNSANGCQSEKRLILADLVYEYESGKEQKIDRLYVFDEKLYRPDDITYDYYAVGIGETEKNLKEVIANELWLTDPALINGQQSTKGKLDIGYDMDGKIEYIELNLSGKFYILEKQGKKLSQITLLIVGQEIEISVTPVLTESSTMVPTATQTPVPTQTPTFTPTNMPQPTVTPTRNPNPPQMKINYPTEGQYIELNTSYQTFCVVDVPDGGDQTGLQIRHNLGHGWSDYVNLTITMCYLPDEGLNSLQLQYRNSHGEESPVYSVNFIFHKTN